MTGCFFLHCCTHTRTHTHAHAHTHTQRMEMLISLMNDPTVQVQDTAAWTIGRVCDQIPEAALSEMCRDSLLLGLAAGLEKEPRVATNVCWVGNQRNLKLHVLMRDEKKKERSKQGQTNKAKQHSTPKVVTFPSCLGDSMHMITLHYVTIYTSPSFSYSPLPSPPLSRRSPPWRSQHTTWPVPMKTQSHRPTLSPLPTMPSSRNWSRPLTGIYRGVGGSKKAEIDRAHLCRLLASNVYTLRIRPCNS